MTKPKAPNPPSPPPPAPAGTPPRRESASAPQSLSPEQVGAADQLRDQARAQPPPPPQPPPGTPPKNKGGRPKGAKNKPKGAVVQGEVMNPGDHPDDWKPYVETLSILFERFGEPPFSPEETKRLCVAVAPVIQKYGGIPMQEELLLLGALATIVGPRALSIWGRMKAAKEEQKLAAEREAKRRAQGAASATPPAAA